MSRPPLNPDKSVAGIALDPQTLQRIIPESKRPDGSVRKQIKIRPGFTPQEDVKRFRGTKQAQMDATSLPKGHIIGWAPPPSSSSTKPGAAEATTLSKSAKKNAKRKEKREKEKVEVPENWDDDDDPAEGDKKASSTASTDKDKSGATSPNLVEGAKEDGNTDSDKAGGGTPDSLTGGVNGLESQLEKLQVK